MRVVVTAGFDGSRSALIVAETARARGHEVLVLVATPFRVARVKSLIRQGGWHALKDAAGRLMRPTARSGSADLDALLPSGTSVLPESLAAWALALGVEHHSVGSLNEPGVVELVRAWGADLLLYNGGGILRAPLLSALNGPVLNAHAGPLPEIRGMNAVEWSVLLGEPTTVTIHQIDEGIDTGRVWKQIPVPIEPGDTIERLRARAVRCGVAGLLEALRARESGELAFESARPARGRQCFVLAPALRELLARRLESHA